MLEMKIQNALYSNIQFLIADDHSLVRHCLSLMIQKEWKNSICQTAENHDSLFQQLNTLVFSIVLLDLRMPGMTGIDSVKQVIADSKGAIVIVCTGLDDPNLINTLKKCGVYAVVHKTADPEVLINEINQALVLKQAQSSLHGLKPIKLKNSSVKYPKNCLTQRQREILQLLHQGKPSKLIARDLGVEVGTVKSHLHSLYYAMNVKNRAEAIVKSQGWLL